ncbi:hypothetical protein [Sphingobium sp. HWE2-09]|uniref:hypothetical protein n=1 Tax=Sphingobium sp. HWE2-09 TaxID=3108390 RepID=UPI002DCD0DE3|nr:hypothetical protein [Sphingobium sp. HWE2-09]
MSAAPSKALGQIFQQAELEAIASALGDTAKGVTNPEIGRLIETCAMVDPGAMTKRHRIYQAFAECPNRL